MTGRYTWTVRLDDNGQWRLDPVGGLAAYRLRGLGFRVTTAQVHLAAAQVLARSDLGRVGIVKTGPATWEVTLLPAAVR